MQCYEYVWGFPGNDSLHLVSAPTADDMCLYELVCNAKSKFGVSTNRFLASFLWPPEKV